jgi:hypothetical protein
MAFDGVEVPPPPMTRCTVPALVSITPVLVSTGIGILVSASCIPRTGCERS